MAFIRINKGVIFVHPQRSGSPITSQLCWPAAEETVLSFTLYSQIIVSCNTWCIQAAELQCLQQMAFTDRKSRLFWEVWLHLSGPRFYDAIKVTWFLLSLICKRSMENGSRVTSKNKMLNVRFILKFTQLKWFLASIKKNLWTSCPTSPAFGTTYF